MGAGSCAKDARRLRREGATIDAATVDVVVVLSYHGYADTLRCVASLVSGSSEAQVVVVDNGSGDGVLEAVAESWPQVATLQTGSNLGFTGGMNYGVRWALAKGASTITVLNNDTVVPAGTIATLATRARSGQVVSPLVRYASDGSLWFGGGVVDPDTALARHLSAEELAGRLHEASPSESLAGCCITASADRWREVGLFDERYYLIFEDAEWSLRARRRGVPLVVDPTATIEHTVSATFVEGRAVLGLYYYVRNGLQFGREWRRDTGRRDLRVPYRFLRRHAVPEVVGPWRRGDRRLALRRNIVVGLAIVHHLRRRYGRAPSWLERRTQTWSPAPL